MEFPEKIKIDIVVVDDFLNNIEFIFAVVLFIRLFGKRFK